MSPVQEAEVAELYLRINQRREMVERFNTQRAAARELAIAQHHGYWEGKRRTEQRAAFTRRVCAQALEQPICFLPKLPEARELALGSWARDETQESPSAFHRSLLLKERVEARYLVRNLNDNLGTMSNIVVRARTRLHA